MTIAVRVLMVTMKFYHLETSVFLINVLDKSQNLVLSYLTGSVIRRNHKVSLYENSVFFPSFVL